MVAYRMLNLGLAWLLWIIGLLLLGYLHYVHRVWKVGIYVKHTVVFARSKDYVSLKDSL